jgi:hypothetical protein
MGTLTFKSLINRITKNKINLKIGHLQELLKEEIQIRKWKISIF